MSGKKKRRRWRTEDKLRIVLAGLEPDVEVSELCRREGINPTHYYGWKKTLLSSAARVFHDQSRRPSGKEQRLEGELSRCKDVFMEITAENLEPKKSRIRRPREPSGGTLATGARGSAADEGPKRLAVAADAQGAGDRPQQLLPLAAGRGVVGAVGTGPSRPGVFSVTGGEAGGAGVRVGTSGGASPGVVLEDDRRGCGLPERLDGVPDSA